MDGGRLSRRRIRSDTLVAEFQRDRRSEFADEIRERPATIAEGPTASASLLRHQFPDTPLGPREVQIPRRERVEPLGEQTIATPIPRPSEHHPLRSRHVVEVTRCGGRGFHSTQEPARLAALSFRA